MKTVTRERLRSTMSLSLIASAVFVGLVGASIVTVHLIEPSVHSRYFLWISARALGLAAYATLWLLVVVGTWMRHPWRTRFRVAHPETRLRIHSALAVATIVLVACHVSVLALDSYAGVGWKGVVIPGAATYRPFAVSLGIVALATIVLLTTSAALAGRRGTRHWLLVHRLGATTFILVWLHGLLAGTDAVALRYFYATTGLMWLVLVTTRVGISRGPTTVDVPSLTNDIPSRAVAPLNESWVSQ